MQIQLDPNIPANLSQEELRDFKTFVDTALDGLTAAAGGEVFATGNAMLAGLAVIVVVLNGLKIAFSPDYAKDLNPSEIWAQKKGRSSLI